MPSICLPEPHHLAKHTSRVHPLVHNCLIAGEVYPNIQWVQLRGAQDLAVCSLRSHHHYQSHHPQRHNHLVLPGWGPSLPGATQYLQYGGKWDEDVVVAFGDSPSLQRLGRVTSLGASSDLDVECPSEVGTSKECRTE